MTVSNVAALFLLAFCAQAFKEIGIPSPGLTQSLLIYTGYQFSQGGFHLGIGILLFTFLGSLCGAYLVFYLARFGGRQLLGKISRYVQTNPAAIEKARSKITNHSFLSVAVGRSIPGLMVPTSLVAGTLNMPPGTFLLGIIFPLSLWIFFLTALGGSLGHFAPHLQLVPGGFLLLSAAVLAFSILFLRNRRKGTQAGQAEEHG